MRARTKCAHAASASSHPSIVRPRACVRRYAQILGEDDVKEIKKAVKTNFLLAHLNEKQQQEVFGAMQECVCKAGDTIIVAGQPVRARRRAHSSGCCDSPRHTHSATWLCASRRASGFTWCTRGCTTLSSMGKRSSSIRWTRPKATTRSLPYRLASSRCSTTTSRALRASCARPTARSGDSARRRSARR